MNSSAVRPGSTRIATFFSSSLWSRSRIWRLVTYSPSCPAKGESLMRKSIVIVGSSTRTGRESDGAVDGGTRCRRCRLTRARRWRQVAGLDLSDLLTLEPDELQQLGDLGDDLAAVGLDHAHLLAGLDHPVEDAADADAAARTRRSRCW
jgi:hypothetical protein